MEICVVASNYTTDKRQVHVFLDNVVRLFVDRGITCNVIAPQSSYSYYKRKDLRRPLKYERVSPKGVSYKIYSPLYTVYPTIKIGDHCLSDRTKYSFLKAIRKTYINMNMNADLIYAHFIQAGIPAVMLAQELGIPSFIANGEADTIDSLKYISRKLVMKTLNNVTGIISVSTKCKDEVFELCGGKKRIMDKVTVIPNAANPDRFHLLNKEECRLSLGFPIDKFIVAFTGSFIARKGIDKVENAINSIDDIYAIFIGTGAYDINCRNILFEGRVKNEEMAKYLNAADVFVLPTQAEGCCNAIVEAILCGLPIISSDRSFNWDILDDSCSILVDPDNQEQINSAIDYLKNNPQKRHELSNGCLNRAKKLTLDSRVDRILEYICLKGEVNFDG